MVGEGVEDTLISAEDSVSDRLPYLAHRNHLKGPACKRIQRVSTSQLLTQVALVRQSYKREPFKAVHFSEWGGILMLLNKKKL